MRICLVTHGFPPVERTGVENYTQGIARAFARAGHRVEVFVPRRDARLGNYSIRREERQGFSVNWVTSNVSPSGPREMLLVQGIRDAFGAFLDRERPEVVHFQHLIKLGIELVEEARKRGIPTVYTAHDYYPVCHRYTLLRPDLAHCDVRGDPVACARCDLALGYLNGLGRLGDYQMGALPEQLSEAEREELSAILRGARWPWSGERAAVELRRGLDALRADAFGRIDLVLAPSSTMMDELVRGGLDRARLRRQTLGFDNADLEGLPPIRSDPARVRFAYLGGLSKHKGLHVLLDAFARVASRAQLVLWGDSSDRAYVDLLREKCSAVGAQWNGAYERADLPRILAEVDALVLPSLWVENHPLSIREAFSARRPVLASRIGALPESVRDGVDGLLFAPGDVDDLARVLARCVEEPDLLPRLAAGIAPVKGADEHARELEAVYAELIAAEKASAESADFPPSLREPLARYRELSGLPTRELLLRVITGLDDLRESWAEDLEGVELLALGLGDGSGAQDLLRESKAEIAWLRSRTGDAEPGREELMALIEEVARLPDPIGDEEAAARQREAEAYVRRKEAEVLEAQARLGELERVLQDKNDHARRVEEQLDQAGRHILEKQQHAQEVEQELGRAGQHVKDKDEHVRSVERQLDEAARYAREKEEHARRIEQQLDEAGQYVRAKEEHARTVERQLDEAGRHIRDKEGEVRDLAGRLERAAALLRAKEGELKAAQDALRIEEERLRAVRDGARSAASVGLEAVRAIERLFGSSLLPALDQVRRMSGRAQGEVPSNGATAPELLRALGRLPAELARLERELDWRRHEMTKLYQRFTDSWIRHLVGPTPLGKRIRTWNEPPGGGA